MIVKKNYNNENNIEIIFVNVTINKSITFPMKQIPNVVTLKFCTKCNATNAI